MGIRELRQTASELKIKNYSRMNKVELEAAVLAASTPPAVSTAEQSIGEVDGRNILISQTTTSFSIGILLGTFDKGNARKVRKVLREAGFNSLAGAKRIVTNIVYCEQITSCDRSEWEKEAA